jgi:hypothetical protein
MQADTGVLGGLAAKVAELERRMDDVVRLHEIIAGAGTPGAAIAAARRRRLHLVTSPPAGRAPTPPGAMTPAGVSPG